MSPITIYQIFQIICFRLSLRPRACMGMGGRGSRSTGFPPSRGTGRTCVCGCTLPHSHNACAAPPSRPPLPPHTHMHTHSLSVYVSRTRLLQTAPPPRSRCCPTPRPPPHSHSHTHTHTRTHACVHTHTHTHTHSHSHSHSHTHTHSHADGASPEVKVLPGGQTQLTKWRTLGRVSHENAVVLPDNRTVYLSDDHPNGGEGSEPADPASSARGAGTRAAGCQATHRGRWPGATGRGRGLVGFALAWRGAAEGGARQPR